MSRRAARAACQTDPESRGATEGGSARRGLLRTIRRFGQLDPQDRRVLIEAALRLAAAYLLVKLVPSRRLTAAIGRFAPIPAAADAPRALPPEHAELARTIGWAVTRAARHVPYVEIACLPQAIAAQRMLRRRGIDCVLYVGGRRDAVQGFQAHAWLCAAQVEVTGYPAAHEFVAISQVASRTGPAAS